MDALIDVGRGVRRRKECDTVAFKITLYLLCYSSEEEREEKSPLEGRSPLPYTPRWWSHSTPLDQDFLTQQIH